MIDPAVWLFVAAQIITAGGVYAAIRADLREAIVNSKTAVKRADDAHQRIDRISERAHP